MAALRSVVVVLAGVAILLVNPAGSVAQEASEIPMPLVEFSAGYTFMRDVTFEDEYPVGWYASGGVNLNRWFGIFAEAGGSYRSQEISPGYAPLTVSEKAWVYTFMAGPRFFYKSGRVIPFAQFLVGMESRDLEQTERWMGGTHSPYTWRSPSESNFSIQPGGGVTVLLTQNLGVRAALDYRSVMDFDDDEVGNEFRVLAGMSFHWGRR